MDPAARAAALDDLAASLRERLIADAGAEGGDLHERIRALVDREAALLDAGARAELVARVAERSFGLGPLEPLLADPAVDEVMVNGAGRGVGRARRAHRAHRRDVRDRRATCATRSSGSSRRSGGASTRPSRCATRGCPTARA